MPTHAVTVFALPMDAAVVGAFAIDARIGGAFSMNAAVVGALSVDTAFVSALPIDAIVVAALTMHTDPCLAVTVDSGKGPWEHSLVAGACVPDDQKARGSFPCLPPVVMRAGGAGVGAGHRGRRCRAQLQARVQGREIGFGGAAHCDGQPQVGADRGSGDGVLAAQRHREQAIMDRDALLHLRPEWFAAAFGLVEGEAEVVAALGHGLPGAVGQAACVFR